MTQDNNSYCIILAGGAGRKFWPVSRVDKPKQFLKTQGSDKTYIRQTFERFSKILPPDHIIVATTSGYEKATREELPELDDNNFIIEPYIRDTAPCVVYATYSLLKRNPDANIVITPCDHKISDENLFCKAIEESLEYTRDHDVLLTLGIEPTRPDTNFGYIQVAGGLRDRAEAKALKVKTFTEKPNSEIARVFIQSGEFLWNSGILVAQASVIREEFEKYLPLLTSQFEGWEEHIGTVDESAFIEHVYGGCERAAISSVMEKTERAWLYPGKFGWTDIGAWETYFASHPKDKEDNVIIADTVIAEDNHNCMVMSRVKGKMVAICGMDSFLVVDTDDVLLICPKEGKKSRDFITQVSLPEFDKYK